MKFPSKSADMMLEPSERTSCGVGVGLVSSWPPKARPSVAKSLLGSMFPPLGEINVAILSGELGVSDSGGLLTGLKIELSLLLSVF